MKPKTAFESGTSPPKISESISVNELAKLPRISANSVMRRSPSMRSQRICSEYEAKISGVKAQLDDESGFL